MSMIVTPDAGNVPRSYDSDFTPGMRWRVMASILGGTAWVIFVLLFVAFVPTGFTLFQSIVVIIVSILAIGATLAAMWASYGMRYSGEFRPSH